MENPEFVMFYAEWCQPCQKIKPFILELKNALQDKVNVVLMSVDLNMEKSQEYKIRSIPTFIYFPKGMVNGEHDIYKGIATQDNIIRFLRPKIGHVLN